MKVPMADRRKTTLWVHPDLWDRVKDVSGEMGVSATAFTHLSLAHFLVAIAPVVGSGVKRKTTIAAARKSFDMLIAKAEESLR